jgi:hypothetical protein
MDKEIRQAFLEWFHKTDKYVSTTRAERYYGDLEHQDEIRRNEIMTAWLTEAFLRGYMVAKEKSNT